MEKVIEVFDVLLNCRTVEEVEKLLANPNWDKRFLFSEDKYPRIQFSITPDEIYELIKSGRLDDKNAIEGNCKFTPMEKLLYALIWKNGDLKKMKHIVSGILSTSEDLPDNGIVFHQYGRFLSGKSGEPIIDQHVMRAFAVYFYREDPKAVKRYLKMELITKSDHELIKKYKKWLTEDLTIELRQTPDYTYYVDKVLFALGSYLKHSANSID